MITPKPVPQYNSGATAQAHPGCSAFHTENHHNHCGPHQVHFCDCMREFDPNDPNNVNRTFDKMVVAANRKHLNPGEMSFHYYVDMSDNKVHGFIAVGNINDRLPHIIITDNTYGQETALEQMRNQLNLIMDNKKSIEAIMEKIQGITGGVQIPQEFLDAIEEVNDLKDRVQNIEDSLEGLDQSEDIKEIRDIIIENEEVTAKALTHIHERVTKLENQNTGNLVKDLITTDESVKDSIKSVVNEVVKKPEWNDLENL